MHALFNRFLHTSAATILFALGSATQAAVPAVETTWLTALYNSTNGSTWTDSANWFTGDPCENNWKGIICNNSKTQITAIYLQNNNLQGSLPEDLNHLSALEIFSVSDNQLTGSIPSLDGLEKLELFYVDNNQLTGSIPPLNNLPAIRLLSLEQNQLTGSIPSLAGLTNLETFYAYENNLTGNIPSLTGLTMLQTLLVHNNQLTGSIPSLNGLTNLEVFYVDSNQLTGSIPALNGLAALRIFGVNDNQLTGSIPALDGLMNLKLFYADNNQLTGNIPVSVSSLNNLKAIWITGNRLTGTVPAAPPNLDVGGSGLCGLAATNGNTNHLIASPDATINAEWNRATNLSDWSAACVPSTAPSAATPVPTLSHLSLLLMGGLLVAFSTTHMRRRQQNQMR